jgi:phosphatidylglycerophosphate synthase
MPAPPVVDIESRPRVPAQRPRGVAAAVALAAAAAIGIAALLGGWLGDGAVVIRAAALATVGGGILLWLSTSRLQAPAFGAANSVTLVMAALAVLLVALFGAEPTPTLGWVVVGLGAAGVALDGVDGALARGRKEASAFGARFDMETDALLILVLAALAWQHGKAGPWVLAAGLLRYLFVAASWASPMLGAQLPPSRRRQAVCVVQIVSLLGALTPLVAPPWSSALAFAGLVALVWSFAVDVRWLARHPRS